MLRFLVKGWYTGFAICLGPRVVQVPISNYYTSSHIAGIYVHAEIALFQTRCLAGPESTRLKDECFVTPAKHWVWKLAIFRMSSCWMENLQTSQLCDKSRGQNNLVLLPALVEWNLGLTWKLPHLAHLLSAWIVSQLWDKNEIPLDQHSDKIVMG